MLNTQRLIDAGFTDEDIRTILGTFETTMSAMNEAIKSMDGKLPFSDEMMEQAMGRSREILDRIKAYKRPTGQDVDEMFDIWAQMLEDGDAE